MQAAQGGTLEFRRGDNLQKSAADGARLRKE